ncbi:hypothetical protein AGDE_17197 [Angomonas deanei]|uniref:Uncharacterized protein n=1 Tax=Angomonas deanei TaxID=59799 RepID=A0A7G2CHG0_9TRYP|nr:hypothetical protein AGDE_17197 [Angomonas deanei]CAD2218859.1 hypothetical protein, conserved [Angomonas deanei]|eukprot:EPY15065.1 hypothetical protein AGDE_17197 [Angomonas deanei]
MAMKRWFDVAGLVLLFNLLLASKTDAVLPTSTTFDEYIPRANGNCDNNDRCGTMVAEGFPERVITDLDTARAATQMNYTKWYVGNTLFDYTAKFKIYDTNIDEEKDEQKRCIPLNIDKAYDYRPATAASYVNTVKTRGDAFLLQMKQAQVLLRYDYENVQGYMTRVLEYNETLGRELESRGAEMTRGGGGAGGGFFGNTLGKLLEMVAGAVISELISYGVERLISVIEERGTESPWATKRPVGITSCMRSGHGNYETGRRLYAPESFLNDFIWQEFSDRSGFLLQPAETENRVVMSVYCHFNGTQGKTVVGHSVYIIPHGKRVECVVSRLRMKWAKKWYFWKMAASWHKVRGAGLELEHFGEYMIAIGYGINDEMAFAQCKESQAPNNDVNKIVDETPRTAEETGLSFTPWDQTTSPPLSDALRAKPLFMVDRASQNRNCEPFSYK